MAPGFDGRVWLGRAEGLWYNAFRGNEDKSGLMLTLAHTAEKTQD